MIRGEKVILRPVDLADAERLAAWLNDDRVTTFLPFWRPLTLKDEEQWLRSEDRRVIRFGIDTLDGQHIGQGSLHADPGNARTSEVGLFIGAKEYWGRGYGTDAVITLCAFGFAYQNLHRIYSHVGAENMGAVRCYEKAGFTHEGRLRQHRYRLGRYWDVLCTGLLCGEFRARFPDRWPVMT